MEEARVNEPSDSKVWLLLVDVVVVVNVFILLLIIDVFVSLSF